MRKMRFKLIGGLLVMVMVFFGGTLSAFAAEVPETHEALAVHGPQCTHEACGYEVEEEEAILLRGILCPSCERGEVNKVYTTSLPYGQFDRKCVHYPFGTDLWAYVFTQYQWACNRCNWASAPTPEGAPREVIQICRGGYAK